MDITCNVAGCTKPRKGAGFCNAHHLRFWRHGDPLGGRARYESTSEYFTSRTEWQGDCLVWIGTIKAGGYGSMHTGGITAPPHRYAFVQAHGAIPEGMEIDHMCHNRACCNVEHLRAVTRKQNLENRKGARTGSRSGYRNVTWIASKDRWLVKLMDFGKVITGGTYPPYEVHVAAFHAKALRNKHFTHNDLDRV